MERVIVVFVAGLLGGGCLSVPAPAATGDGGGEDGGGDDQPIPGPTDGLVAYWSMDGLTDGNTLIDSLGNHHGGCESCPLDYAPYVGTGALRFSDTESIVVPYSPTFDLESGTISAWIYLEAWSDGAILARPVGGADQDSYLLGVVPAGALLLEYPGGVDLTDAQVPLSGWAHVAASWSPMGRDLYVDGVQSSFAARAPSFDASPLLIGSDRNSNVDSNHWIGVIDDLRLYDRVLSPGELAEILDL